jgi:toxin ParE1/3/4
MSASFQITNLAEIDLLEIWLYIARDNVRAANRFTTKITDRFPLLARFPDIGQQRDDLHKGLRSFPVGKYIIFYQRQADGVLIVRVLHGARDIGRLFDE